MLKQDQDKNLFGKSSKLIISFPLFTYLASFRFTSENWTAQ